MNGTLKVLLWNISPDFIQCFEYKRLIRACYILFFLEIQVYPDNITIVVFFGNWLSACYAKQYKEKYKWDIEGPGKLLGRIEGDAIFYILPNSILSDSEKVIINSNFFETEQILPDIT